MAEETPARLGIDAVVVGVRDDTPLVLTFADRRPAAFAERGLRPARDRTLELAARRVLGEQAGLPKAISSNSTRSVTAPRSARSARRTAFRERRLPRAGRHARVEPRRARPGVARLVPFFPWEDARAGPPGASSMPRDRAALAALDRGRAARRGRAFRARVAFGLDGAPWNNEAVLERYECLYELSRGPGGCNAHRHARRTDGPRPPAHPGNRHRPAARQDQVPAGRVRTDRRDVHALRTAEHRRGAGRPAAACAAISAGWSRRAGSSSRTGSPAPDVRAPGRDCTASVPTCWPSGPTRESASVSDKVGSILLFSKLV